MSMFFEDDASPDVTGEVRDPAGSGELALRGPRRFRAWRRGRPFWAGVFSILGGLDIALIPLTAYRVILVSHSVALAALVGAVVVLLGVLMWTTPGQNKFYGLLVVLLGVVSFVTSNVGGFLLGGLLSIVGGALGFAWVVDEAEEPAGGSEAEPA